MKEHINAGNKIIEYDDGTFLATRLKQGDIVSRYCRTLQEAKEFIRKPRKLITAKDIRGIHLTRDISDLLLDINRKGDINGWYFSSWWFDIRHSANVCKAMFSIIWQILVNNVKRFGFTFNDGTEAQLDLKEAATFIGDKLNGIWWETIVKEFRSMAYSDYDITVNDRCGLNTLYIKLKK